MTAPNFIPFRCEECDATFDPLDGAACRTCRRVLCSHHFAISDRIKRRIGTADEQWICSSCRKKEEAGTPAS